ncbi:MAG TPA: lytic transglycosylase domain-containing protein [Ktedonobacteraceae bacterium]|nr:lytic transglycosylase domain-containing protein [Ktedonobacteraceae bacterium]
MQQFRPFLPFQPTDEADLMEEEPAREVDSLDISATAEPLILQTGEHHVVTTGLLTDSSGTLYTVPSRDTTRTTEPLEAITDTLPTITVTPSLTTALQEIMSSRTAERIVFIPGSEKQKSAGSKITTPLPRQMSPRLRQGIVLASLVFVVIVSLVSLSPLATGEYGVPIIGGISNWFQEQQLIWQLQVQNTESNLPPPPPVSLPNSQYVTIAQQDAINAGISPDYFVRQINQESLFNPNAVSPAGAIGIAQFMPSTAASVGVDPRNPTQALQGAARLMASYVSQYSGNYAMALAAYNAGIAAVQYAVNYCGANWMNCLPAETRNYIYVIMGI